MLFSLLRFVPWPAAMVTKFNAYIIDPPAFGSKHRTPIANAAHIPTRGQALFVFYLIALNIILCAVGYKSFQPSAWYATSSVEIQEYVADRYVYKINSFNLCGLLTKTIVAVPSQWPIWL